MTRQELQGLVKAARDRYDALSPAEKAWHDHEQRRSFVRGMCSSKRDYNEWCEVVDRVIPPLPKPAPAASERDPIVIIAGIRRFGLAPDGSDLRDLETAIRRQRDALQSIANGDWERPFGRVARVRGPWGTTAADALEAAHSMDYSKPG